MPAAGVLHTGGLENSVNLTVSQYAKGKSPIQLAFFAVRLCVEAGI